MAVRHFSMMNEVDIQVVDTNGRIIAQSPSLISSLDSHMPMMQEHMGKLPGSSLIEMQKLVLGKTTEVPVFAHNKKVATVLVTPLVKPGELDEDQRFKASINSALILGGLVATLVALGLSFFISTRMTKPLSLMTVSAKKMEQGDLSQRIEVKGQDEISQLGEAFNHLSMALARQENLRKNLTADIAHELRTPLTTLRTHLEAVLDGVMPPSKENLQSMHEEILRLTRLVDDLGKLAEAESGALKLNLNEEDIHKLIKKVTTNMQPLFQEKDVKLVTELNAGQNRLKIDKDKVQQVAFFNPILIGKNAAAQNVKQDV
jgi:signal transduction histidine kinase